VAESGTPIRDMLKCRDWSSINLLFSEALQLKDIKNGKFLGVVFAQSLDFK
jgi:hypothetical protein